MHLKTRNVNTAFQTLVAIFDGGEYPGASYSNYGVEDATHDPVEILSRPSRNGNVLIIDEPVTITYTHPRERVLFNAARDANPFFHVYEALWMLAGRNDVAPLAYYVKRMADFSDDGKTFNGAYGYRWRRHTTEFCGVPPGEHYDGQRTVDQLDLLIAHLKADPNSRRAVLQMWTVEDDLLKIGKVPADYARKEGFDVRPADWLPASKDVCCNLSVMFSLRYPVCDATKDVDGRTFHCSYDYGHDGPHESGCGEWNGPAGHRLAKLDMAVTNRSNDLVWGLLGANYVHFTFLQEYVAARLGAEVGRYHHFTNNLHVYDWNWKPEEWLTDAHIQNYGFHEGAGAKPEYSYPAESRSFVPLVKDPAAFEADLPKFVEHHSGKLPADELEGAWTEPFFQGTAGPMLCAFACYKEKDFHSAFMMIDQVEADDWRVAGRAWLERRYAKRKEAASASAD